MGRSRSATCVIMYVMKRFGIGFEEAIEFVRSRRDCVDPNEGFLRQLREFEEKKFEFGFGRDSFSQASNEVPCLVMRRHSIWC